MANGFADILGRGLANRFDRGQGGLGYLLLGAALGGFDETPEQAQARQLQQMQQQATIDALQAQSAQQSARATLFGGADPETGITWNQPRQGMSQQQIMQTFSRAFPQRAAQRLEQQLFPAQEAPVTPDDLVMIQTPKGPQYVRAGAAVGQSPFLSAEEIGPLETVQGDAGPVLMTRAESVGMQPYAEQDPEYRTLSADEIAQAMLPVGTVAQRQGQGGKIEVLLTPEEQAKAPQKYQFFGGVWYDTAPDGGGAPKPVSDVKADIKPKDRYTNVDGELVDLLDESGAPKVVELGIGEPNKAYTTIPVDEAARIGLPAGTVAQRAPDGKIEIISEPKAEPLASRYKQRSDGSLIDVLAPGGPALVDTLPAIKEETQLLEMPADVRRTMFGNFTTSNSLDRAITSFEEAIEEGDSTSGIWVGLLSKFPIADRAILQGKSPEHQEQIARRALVANIGSLLIHQRSGAVVTAKEFPRLRPFVPEVGDSEETILTKLKALKREADEIVKDSYEFFGRDYLMPAPVVEKYGELSGPKSGAANGRSGIPRGVSRDDYANEVARKLEELGYSVSGER